eukprot:SAG11_NODE_635_length_8040_cov_3.233472_2_plen_363_part_00
MAELAALRDQLDPGSFAKLVQVALLDPAVLAYAKGVIPAADIRALRSYLLSDELLQQLKDSELVPSSFPDLFGKGTWRKFLLPDHEFTILSDRTPEPDRWPRKLSFSPAYDLFSKADCSEYNRANDRQRGLLSQLKDLLYVSCALLDEEVDFETAVARALDAIVIQSKLLFHGLAKAERTKEALAQKYMRGASTKPTLRVDDDEAPPVVGAVQQAEIAAHLQSRSAIANATEVEQRLATLHASKGTKLEQSSGGGKGDGKTRKRGGKGRQPAPAPAPGNAPSPAPAPAASPAPAAGPAPAPSRGGGGKGRGGRRGSGKGRGGTNNRPPESEADGYQVGSAADPSADQAARADRQAADAAAHP